jgi:hypothetical protein
MSTYLALVISVFLFEQHGFGKLLIVIVSCYNNIIGGERRETLVVQSCLYFFACVSDRAHVSPY